MKKIILINFFTLLMTMVFFTTAYGQQRPSQRSFTSVMNQVNQKQIARDKMIQQIKQTTPSNSGNIQLQPSTSNSTQQAAAQQRSQLPRTNQQSVIKKQANQQQVRIKKE